MKPCGMIGLLSDFGHKDPFVGIVKGVMLSIAPELRLVDLSHEVKSQNVAQGAFLLSTCLDYFPDGTVFWAVVDPSVGSGRRAVAVQGKRHYYVGPDNGMFALCWQHDEFVSAVEIDAERWGLPNLSSTFHGRDIFAPAAAHLAHGVALADIGKPISSLCAAVFPVGQRSEAGNGQASIVHIDTFGNLITSWPQREGEKVRGVAWNGAFIAMHRTYDEVPRGELLSYWGSAGYLEIGASCASAQEVLKARLQDEVSVVLE